MVRALAVTCEDERPSTVVVLEIMFEGASNIVIGEREQRFPFFLSA